MLWRCLFYVVWIVVLARLPGQVSSASRDEQISAPAELRARIEASPVLPFQGVPFAAYPLAGVEGTGAASGVAVAADGTVYELRRTDTADPILVLDPGGRVLRSWGKGDFSIPHSIHIDSHGHVWTVDAGSSNVIEYTRMGQKLRTISVGRQSDSLPAQPASGDMFTGTTDVAFGPKGHVFITDGYTQARVLEFTARGKRVRQWGRPGSAPGEFKLPHALQIDGRGIIYVADRENGRVQRFDAKGRFISEIDRLGRIYSLHLGEGALWASMGPFDQPPGAAGWIVELHPRSGKILGHLDVPDRGGHSLALTPSGEPLITVDNHLLWFERH